VGFDAGPPFQPTIDTASGCCAGYPIAAPSGAFGFFCGASGNCVQCAMDSDCMTGQSCQNDPNNYNNQYMCVDCLPGGTTCPAGTVCDSSVFLCVASCIDGGLTCPSYTFCQVDAGTCSYGCVTDSDCSLNPFGTYCVGAAPDSPGNCGCFDDGGGCTGAGMLCSYSQCVVDCTTDAGLCSPSTYCETDSGICLGGCLSNSDCASPVADCYFDAGAGTVGQCAECLQSSDCSDARPGCALRCLGPLCHFGHRPACGYCLADGDCPTGLHCEGNQCLCHADTECTGLPNADAPVCLGLDTDAGVSGVCGCQSSTDCATGSVCEPRSPDSVYYNSNGMYLQGGLCIQSCAGAAANYCSSTGIYLAATCNQTTGYCVECATDNDCTNSPKDSPGYLEYPNCILLPDGGSNPVTGGGVCGCTSTSSCSNGLTCADNQGGSQCQPACTLTGVNAFCGNFGQEGFCDTWTGLCQQCLADYDCTGVMNSFYNGQSNPSCLTLTAAPDGTGAGSMLCGQCADFTGCPADLPGCVPSVNSYSYAPPGTCGFCNSAADCPPDAGTSFTCDFFQPGFATQCLAPCVSDGLGTGGVSDAGQACPTALPFCVQAQTAADAGYFCSECRDSTDCTGTKTSCNGNFCQ
jgi:hypothetical protein